jgi:hypothetical protein
VAEPFFILFKFPSRGRPQRFFDSLDNIVAHIGDWDYHHISCSLDLDDYTMNNLEVRERVKQYTNVSVEWGYSDSKIHAVNRSMPDMPFDILINMSDDMRFNLYGFDRCIRVDMNAHFPNFDGLLHYPDQDAKEYLATMYIAGREFYRKFGFIYDPKFKSLWCDNLIMKVAQHMEKYKYCGYQINVHLNPAYGHLQKDELFNRQQEDWNHDEGMYNSIISNGIDEYLKSF